MWSRDVNGMSKSIGSLLLRWHYRCATICILLASFISVLSVSGKKAKNSKASASSKKKIKASVEWMPEYGMHGLFASEDVKTGDVILAEEPLIRIKEADLHEQNEHLQKNERFEDILDRILELQDKLYIHLLRKRERKKEEDSARAEAKRKRKKEKRIQQEQKRKQKKRRKQQHLAKRRKKQKRQRIEKEKKRKIETEDYERSSDEASLFPDINENDDSIDSPTDNDSDESTDVSTDESVDGPTGVEIGSNDDDVEASSDGEIVSDSNKEQIIADSDGISDGDRPRVISDMEGIMRQTDDEFQRDELKSLIWRKELTELLDESLAVLAASKFRSLPEEKQMDWLSLHDAHRNTTFLPQDNDLVQIENAQAVFNHLDSWKQKTRKSQIIGLRPRELGDWREKTQSKINGKELDIHNSPYVMAKKIQDATDSEDTASTPTVSFYGNDMSLPSLKDDYFYDYSLDSAGTSKNSTTFAKSLDSESHNKHPAEAAFAYTRGACDKEAWTCSLNWKAIDGQIPLKLSPYPSVLPANGLKTPIGVWWSNSVQATSLQPTGFYDREPSDGRADPITRASNDDTAAFTRHIVPITPASDLTLLKLSSRANHRCIANAVLVDTRQPTFDVASSKKTKKIKKKGKKKKKKKRSKTDGERNDSINEHEAPPVIMLSVRDIRKGEQIFLNYLGSRSDQMTSSAIEEALKIRYRLKCRDCYQCSYGDPHVHSVLRDYMRKNVSDKAS